MLNGLFVGSDFRSATISDAVALSSACTATGLQHMIAVTEILANKLLSLGYFIRRAIVKNRLFHNDEIAFGAGLVRAYTFESTIAVYPRVMLAREVIRDIDQFAMQAEFHNFFSDCKKRSDDGPHYLHCLRMHPRRLKQLEGHKKEKTNPNADAQSAIDYSNQIQLRLDEAVDNPNHYRKVHWFAAYWNDVLYGIDGLPKIDAPGLQINLTI
jgi:hypothetical protein